MDLENEIAKRLSEYSEEFEKEFDELAESTAKKAVSALKASSPRRKGKYASHWKVTKDKEGSYVIHNAPKTYRLTHLLERGHLLRNGGRAKAQPHIAKVEQEVIEEMSRGVERIAQK